MPASPLPLLVTPAVAPQPRTQTRVQAGTQVQTQPGSAAPDAAGFGAVLGQAGADLAVAVQPRSAAGALTVAKGREIPARDGEKGKIKADAAAASPQAAPAVVVVGGAVAGSFVAGGAVAQPVPADFSAEGSGSLARSAQGTSLAAAPAATGDGAPAPGDAPSGTAPSPRVAAVAPRSGGGKAVAAASAGSAATGGVTAFSVVGLPASADSGALDATQDEAAPVSAPAGPAAAKLRAVPHDATAPGARGAAPVADPAGAPQPPAPGQAVAEAVSPQAPASVPGLAAAAPAHPPSGTQPQAAAPAPAPAPSTLPAPPAAQLGQAVGSLHVGAGSNGHVSIRLDPEALGGVRIDVRRAEDGTAAVTLTVERPQTLHVLQADLSHLHQALDRAGVPAEQRSVSLHLAAPEDHAGARDAAAGGGGRPGQQGEPQERPRSAPSFAAGREPAGWQPGLPVVAPRLLRAGFDITA